MLNLPPPLGPADPPPWLVNAGVKPKLLTLLMPRRAAEDGTPLVLLGLKKRGFGAGFFNGFGGKVEASDASVAAAAVRELAEESGLVACEAALRRCGTLVFHFDSNPQPWRVAVYELREWAGEAVETEEMAPEWTPEAAIPYDKMWADDALWYPHFLAGRAFQGTFWFRDTTRLVGHSLAAVEEAAMAADAAADRGGLACDGVCRRA